MKLRLFALLFWVICPAAAAYADFCGQVVHIADGDTETVLVGKTQIRVRLADIDAPEKSQPYGQAAKQALAALTFGKDVCVQDGGPDRYGRTIGVITAGGVNVNEAMVQQGAAWVYPQYNHDPQIAAMQADAQAAKRGMWALQADQRIPPWEWRKQHLH